MKGIMGLLGIDDGELQASLSKFGDLFERVERIEKIVMEVYEHQQRLLREVNPAEGAESCQKLL